MISLLAFQLLDGPVKTKLLHQFQLQRYCRFVEVDDELISVITDVEEDDLGSTTGYHNALPLEVQEFKFCRVVPDIFHFVCKFH